MQTGRTNWAGNYIYRAARWHYPETVEQVQKLVRRLPRLKVLGTCHSFNDIADSQYDLISLEHLDPTLSIDHQRRRVTVSAGLRYGDLCRYLDGEGYALHNLASLPHISIAGACATGTHGSGDANGNLASAVAHMEIVTADGELIEMSRDRDGDRFFGAVVHLGGIGVVTRLSLDVVPRFDLKQVVFENLPLSHLEKHFDDLMSSAYSVSLFTGWQEARISQVWLKRRLAEAASRPLPALSGASPAPDHRHPIRSLSAENCTEQLGIPGPWHERLPHFRMDYMPSSGQELQSEYILPRRHAFEALLAVDRLGQQVAPLLFISEVRTIAADALWMSPAYQQASVCIHFTWKQDWPQVRKVLPLLEASLEPYGARPHWGKLFAMPADRLQALYPRLPDFRELLLEIDPDGKFRNAFLERYLFDRS